MAGDACKDEQPLVYPVDVSYNISGCRLLAFVWCRVPSMRTHLGAQHVHRDAKRNRKKREVLHKGCLGQNVEKHFRNSMEQASRVGLLVQLLTMFQVSA